MKTVSELADKLMDLTQDGKQDDLYPIYTGSKCTPSVLNPSSCSCHFEV